MKRWIVEIEVVGDGDIINTDLFRSITSHPDSRVICEGCYVCNYMKLVEDEKHNGGTAEAEQQKFMETFKIGDRVLFQSPSSPDEKYRTNGGPH